jgi:hypothetical protein
MNIEISIGEIVDKLSILNIKKDNIDDEEKSYNINKEFLYLHEIVFSQLNIDYQEDYLSLFEINKSLWDIEDKLRDKERNKEFDDEFIELARLVYFTNDKRAELKKHINLKYNSNFIEEKSYAKY